MRKLSRLLIGVAIASASYAACELAWWWVTVTLWIGCLVLLEDDDA